LAAFAAKTQADWQAEQRAAVQANFTNAQSGFYKIIGDVPVIGDVLEIFTGIPDADPNDFGSAVNKLKSDVAKAASDITALVVGVGGTVVKDVTNFVTNTWSSVKTGWDGFWDGVFGTNNRIGSTPASVKTAANYVSSTANTASATAGQAATSANTAQQKANDAQSTAVDNAKQVAQLKAQQEAASNSGNSDIDGFDYTTTTGLSASWSLSGTGTVKSDGRALVWVSGTGTVLAKFVRTSTVTTSQQVSVVIDENVFAAASSSASPTPMLGLVLRLDSTWSSYVYARIVPTSTVGRVELTLWKVSGGSEAQITVAGAGIYSWILKIGDTIRVTALTSGSTITFRVYVNGSEVTSINDSASYGGFLSADTAANTLTGLMLRGSTYVPPGIGAFSISDISAPTVVGSGIKVRRTAATTGAISTGDNIFPLGWFGDVPTSTPDLTYDSSGSNTGRVTVSIEGWYHCNFSVVTTGNSASSGNIHAILWTGSGIGSRSVAFYGHQSRFNAPGGTAPVLNGSFLIYLKAGEWVEPGYSSNVNISNAIGSTDSNFNKLSCWWTVALVNRSYS
jgi:hypothetical protein